MGGQNTEKNDKFSIKTPYERIGAGFFIMVVLGAIFAVAVGEDFEGFSVIIWGVYAMISGPLILDGVISLFNVYFKYAPWSVALAHYAAVVARSEKADSWTCVLVFGGVYTAIQTVLLIKELTRKDK